MPCSLSVLNGVAGPGNIATAKAPVTERKNVVPQAKDCRISPLIIGIFSLLALFGVGVGLTIAGWVTANPLFFAIGISSTTFFLQTASMLGAYQSRCHY